jgi:hypothetical protein
MESFLLLLKQSTGNMIINQAISQRYYQKPFWKFGVLVTQTHSQGLDIDTKNGNIKWQDMEATEMRQLPKYQIFADKGKNGEILLGYKKIRCHMVHDIKNDGKNKARLLRDAT